MKYISLDEVIEILSEMQGRCTTKAALVHNSKIWHKIKGVPSVQIVRCKDCLNFYNNHLCLHWSKYGSIDVKPDDFCSIGEKLNENKTK